MVDELTSRRCRFRSGTPICLGNKQEWIFPGPIADREFQGDSTGVDYVGLIRAVEEAQDLSERRMAELALAIFLVELNYELSSADLVTLFSFPPRSTELANSQRAFESLAGAHIRALAGLEEHFVPTPAPSHETWSPGRRLLSWLRDRGLFPKSLATSRKGEALS